MAKRIASSKKPSVAKQSVNLNTAALGALLLQEAHTLAREKCLSSEAVIMCLQRAFAKVIGHAYHMDQGLDVTIDPVSGVLHVWRLLPGEDGQIPESPSASFLTQSMQKEHLWHTHEARHAHNLTADDLFGHKGAPSSNPSSDVHGPTIIHREPLPLPEFNRVMIQHLKTALMRNIQDIERQRQCEEFKDRIGQIVSCTIKQIDGGNLIVEIGRTEAFIPRTELIPRENYIVNERLKAYVYDVRAEAKGPQIFLSRAHPGFLMRLMAQEIPEIYDGTIEIKAIARDPGSRAKVAIASREDRLFDAIGACVGVRGSRVNIIGQELCGEKIDIIPWSGDLPVFVVNALVPAEILKVVVEDKDNIRVVVPDNQQGIAIGKRGQNVKLAHQLTGVNIDIVTESQHTSQLTQNRDAAVQTFVQRLDVEEMMAHFLVSEGFESIEDLLAIPLEALAQLQGMNVEIAQELHHRAQEAQKEMTKETIEAFYAAGGQEAVVHMPHLPMKALPVFTKAGILSIQDVADLSLDEMMDIMQDEEEELRRSELWETLIMQARETIFSHPRNT